MFSPDRDFVCTEANGILRCEPRQAAATSAFRALQTILTQLLPHVPDAPKLPIKVDGVIGPTTALAVQVIAGRLSQGKHRNLSNLAVAQPEEAMPLIAAGAMEIAGYLDEVIASDPTALIATPVIEAKPSEGLGATLLSKKMLAAGAAVAGFVGIGLLAHMSSRRSNGTVDRAHLLPESDGSDQFDDADYDHGDASEAAPEPDTVSA